MSNAARILGASVLALLPAADIARADSPGAHQLDNGLTVLLRPVSGAKQTAVVVLFDLGGDHDPPGKSGRAHLLEHLYCTAAAGDAPARTFAEIQQRYGTGYNQQTGVDYTVFAGVVKPAMLAEEVKDAAARMGALHITDADLKREVPRVLAELRNMYGGIPALAGLNHVRMGLHPIAQGGRHGGNAEHIKTIRLTDLQKLWREHYKPNNAVLVVAGALDDAKTRELVRKHFGPIPSGQAPPMPARHPEAETGATRRVKVKPVIPKASGVAAVGYAAPLPGSADYAPLLVVVSRLWAKSQGAFRPGQVPPLYYPPLDDPGTIALQASLPAGTDAAAVPDQLRQRLQAALTPKLTPQDKVAAVNAMWLLGTADVPDALWARNVYGLAFSVGRQHQLKIDGKQLRAAILRVTDADLQRLDRSVFVPAKSVSVIIDVED